MPLQADPQPYIVAGSTIGAFAFIVKLITRYQGSVTSVAFDRIDKLENDLTEERQRCDGLETESRRMSAQLWRLQSQLDRFILDNDSRNKGDG